MKVTNNMVLFWGGVFSQWSKESDNGLFQIQEDELKFVTAEQYMMWRKALLFNDTEIAAQILQTSDPKKQKSLGRQVQNFSEKIWKENREGIVYYGNLLKFSQNIKLREQLLSFPGKRFVEASPNDNIWGIGLHYNNTLALDEKNWRGQNLLGKALDKVRNTLQEQV
jgi:hypothetical protein